MKTKIKCSFRIMDFKCSHNDITQALHTEPTTTWSAGDKIPRTRLVQKQNGWSIDFELAEGENFNEQIDSMLRKLHPFHQNLMKSCGHYYAELACIYYIYGDERPEIHFNAEIIEKLSDFNAHIDVDLYLVD